MSAEASQETTSEATGPSRLGRLLRTERERQGTKLVKIAAETRVGVHYLAALEHSDYDELPGEVFTKGYVRAYADFLGLDADEMTDLYLGETADRRAAAAIADDEKIVREMSRVLQVAPDRSHYLLWSIVGTVLVLLAVAVGWWLFAEPDPEQPARTNRSPTSEAAALTAVDTTPKTGTPGLKPIEAESKPQAPPIAAPIDPQDSEPLPPAAEARDTLESQPAVTAAKPEAPEPVREQGAEVVVSEFGVGRQVIDRNLVDRGDRFEEGAEVWFWTRILGAEPGTILQHVWLHEGVEVSRISLNIGASHWRTQSRKTLHPGSAGNWAVEVRDQAGKTLARAAFSCAAPG